jgi:hypothetical protein
MTTLARAFERRREICGLGLDARIGLHARENEVRDGGELESASVRGDPVRQGGSSASMKR